MSAMVNPANAPPSSTKATATARYTHSVGAAGDIGGSSSSASALNNPRLVGAAVTLLIGREAIPNNNNLTTDMTMGREAVKLLGACTLWPMAGGWCRGSAMAEDFGVCLVQQVKEALRYLNYNMLPEICTKLPG